MKIKVKKDDYTARNNTVTTASLTDVVEKAKEVVAERYDGPHHEVRKWLTGVAPDSYGSAAYRVTTYVREGSPPKGYVLVLRESRSATVLALGLYGTFIHSWSVKISEKTC